MMSLNGSPTDVYINIDIGGESLSDRRWGRRMALFYKIRNGLAPSYLFEHIPNEDPVVCLRKFVPKAPIARTARYKNSFFSLLH